jgi:tetratricopeptide (TPR) repeat protein
MGSKKKKKKEQKIHAPIDISSGGDATASKSYGLNPRVKTLLLLSAILLLTITVYSNSINNGFVKWDDNENVYENISIRQLNVTNIKTYFTKPLLSMYTPLVYISYAIDYKIGGLDPWIFHLTNLLLHMLNTALLFFIVRQFTQRVEIAVIVSLFFAVHPLNTGAVAPASTRSALLYSLFYLAAFYYYILYLKSNYSPKYLVLSCVLFIMSLLSKSAAVVLPLLLCLVDYYYRRKPDFRAIAEKVPFFVLSLIFGILTFILREDAGHMGSQYVFSVFDRIFLVGYSIVFYMFKVFIPVKLSAFYPYPAKIDGFLPLWFYLAPFAIAAVMFLIYKLKNYGRELIFGALFFLINIVLVLKVVPMGDEMVCDRYAYLPYIGFFLIIGWSYCWIADRPNNTSGRIKHVFMIALVVYGMVFSAVSYERIKVWKNSLTLFNDVLEKYPSEKSPYVGVIYNNRGNFKKEHKDYSGAMDDYNKAIELFPGDALAYNNRGTARIEWKKDYAGAMADYNKSIEIRPDLALAFYNRGNLKKEHGDIENAIADYSRAVEIIPEYVDAYVNRGNAKKVLRDYYGAVSDYNKAIELNPKYPPAFFNRALLKAEQNNYEGALADYNSILEMDPYNFRAYYERGNIKIAQKDYEGAIGEFSRAIALNPDYAYAYHNRGTLRMMMKKYAEAVADYSEVLRLSPQSGDVYFSRAWGRLQTGDKGGACSDWRRSFELGTKEAAGALRQHCK